AKQTRGKIEYADGGTFFLDEVGDLPMSLQAKLLRFLQQRVIERVGGREEIPVDVRVVCATHRELPALIRAGSFREDLYYRISEITLNIPPLRERDGDTVLIARAFLERYSQKLGKSFKGYTREALTALENYAWPGNVRELENKVKRAVIMAEGSQITADDLELEEGGEPALPLNLRRVREQAERQALTRAIAYVDGNLSQAADILGITRPTLYALLNKYNMKT
ncbi:MAG TPA: sigma 54-interacting transcriptional regulator, partial [Plasticicumulans sp.]|nr:sigma 54-interacting transcriptional regulator [Plasticicumulans sp.]